MSATAPASPGPLSGALPLGWPALLYGVRLWGAVCLALFLAFWLELPEPSWAGTTAAIVCQPAVGASLRKGWFRIIGTIAGAIAILIITAAFPQSRAGYLITLAIWGGACAMAASLLRNYASYSAALAGYTAPIIAGGALGDVGGPGTTTFLLALMRATEILIGIASGTMVMALTDTGRARSVLRATLAGLSSDILRGLTATVSPNPPADAGRPWRRDLLRQAGGLGITLDQAAGEISGLPFRPRILQHAVNGLFYAISAWRMAATHRAAQPEARDHAAARVLACLPPELTRAAERGVAHGEAMALRDTCLAAARQLLRLDDGTPALRLLADGIAEGLLGLRRVLLGVALLHAPARIASRTRAIGAPIPDLLPSLISGIRAFLAIGLAMLIWVITAWPGGATVFVFCAVAVILLGPGEAAAFVNARTFLIGTMAAAVLGAVLAYAVLPLQSTFLGFCLALGLVLVPAGAMSGQAWQQMGFVALAVNLLPVLGPTNPETYNPAGTYNFAEQILLGMGIAMISFVLIPPLSPETRARRLLTLTLRDLRRLTRQRRPGSILAWQRRCYARLAAMPDQVDGVQHARLVTALAVGSEVLRLRMIATRLGLEPALAPVLAALREGRSGAAIAALQQFDAALDSLPPPALARRHQRVRASGLAITEALGTHQAYFDAAAPA